MASKRVIILEGKDATRTYRVCYWLDVPAIRRPFYANANRVSAYRDATAAELTALRDGSVAEVVETVTFPLARTVAQIQGDLAARWQAGQTAMTNGGAILGVETNQFERYGTFLAGDGSAWTNITVG
jgi:hypothetical protein